MAGKDYYKILGVARTATADELKKAFHKLAMQCHPDRHPGDKAAEERFKEINEAYAVLSDPEKRKQYDTFGAEGFGQRFSREDIFSGFDLNAIFEDLGIRFGGGGGGGGGSVFDALFGRTGGGAKGGRGGGRAQWGGPFGFDGAGAQARPGGDAIADLRVGFRESIQGGERVVSVPLPGGGWEQVSVRIPAGIASGKKLRVRGKGQASPFGGPRGDLYLTVVVDPDPVFQRDGDDLRCEVRVPPSTLVLGGAVEVPTLSDPKRVKIKPGTQAGAQIRLPGLGVQRPHGRQGDLYARLMPRLPAQPDDRIRELFRQLADAGY